jgi:DNA polymerase
MKRVWLDLETRSRIPIKRGVSLYSTAAQIIMAQWAVGAGDVTIEDLTERGQVYYPSDELVEHLATADEIYAHGAEFEQQLIRACWSEVIVIPPEKWRCTMALSRMHGLPGGLDKLCHIFKLPPELAKDDRGKELIQLFCVPNKDGSYSDRHSHPGQWVEFMHYGGQDIHAMRAIYKHCPKWNATPRMWRTWHLDQAMNANGVAVDLKLCQGAMEAAEAEKKRLAKRTAELTYDEDLGISAVEATTQRKRLLLYLADHGVTLPDLTADTVERRLEDEDLPEAIKELLRIRQQASKSAGAKYKRALNQHVEGRLRNLLVFCGASRTGRWAGRTFQPQNLPRPKHAPWDIEGAIEAFRNGSIARYTKSDVLGLANSSLRGIMVAKPGHKLVVADLANIEGRDMAWVAGEDWKLDAFAAYDRKEGPDLYKVAYARPFNINPNDIADDGDWRRQIGKVMELALQYYGGVGAFCSMAETYGLRLEEMSRVAWPVIPMDFKRKAAHMWVGAVKRRRTYGLTERVWMVCQALVLMWREAHPAIVGFWFELESAVKMAVRNPGKKYPVGKVVLDREANWLRIKLPSGRYLSYPAPRADEDLGASFIGVNPYTKQWGRISTYSGKLAENIVQGSSADILMDGLVAAAEAGYNPVLSVHDEIICEPPDDPQFTDRGLSRIMTESSPWTAGMPLAAKGFTAYRYAKH